MEVRVGQWRKLSTGELMLLNYGVGEVSETHLDWKKIQPVHPKGDQSWVFIERIDVKAETPILRAPHEKSWLSGKDPNAGKDWGQKKGMTEDGMVGWHHRLNGHGFGWTPGVGDGQGGLECCDSWGRKKLDTTERLNWTEIAYLGTVFQVPSGQSSCFVLPHTCTWSDSGPSLMCAHLLAKMDSMWGVLRRLEGHIMVWHTLSSLCLCSRGVLFDFKEK